MMDGVELEKEMILASHMLANVRAAAAGDPVANQHVVRDSLALCRWHSWTPDSVHEFLSVMLMAGVG